MYINKKPKLYIYYDQATHFLKWEVPLFSKYFNLVDKPGKDTILFAFGPDVIERGAQLEALKRFGYILPGFGFNPVYNLPLREKMKTIIDQSYDGFFINPGPLEIAYGKIKKVNICQFGIDPKFKKIKRFRNSLDSLIHVSSNYPQKDWQRNEGIMRATGLKFEVYPPRTGDLPQEKKTGFIKTYNKLAEKTYLKPIKTMPHGYVSHAQTIKKYMEYDGFVHIAKDIKSEKYIDGKYTASLMEAGATGAILFWHDTFMLGNHLETVFELPLDIKKAAKKILDVRASIDVHYQSKRTREEILDVFSAEKSVKERSEKIISLAG